MKIIKLFILLFILSFVFFSNSCKNFTEHEGSYYQKEIVPRKNMYEIVLKIKGNGYVFCDPEEFYINWDTRFFRITKKGIVNLYPFENVIWTSIPENYYKKEFFRYEGGGLK